MAVWMIFPQYKRILLLACLVVVTGCAQAPQQPLPQSTPVAKASQKPIKLGAFTPQPAPTIENSCAIDTGKIPAPGCTCTAFWITCQNKRCVNIETRPGFEIFDCDHVNQARWCETPGLAPTDGRFCIDKPIVYLYPTTDTLVAIMVQSPGRIVQSIPDYPAGGWQDILARPNGQLTYKNAEYGELFYETAISSYRRPRNGLTIPTPFLKPLLAHYTTQLGLVGREQEEFLAYWVPRLGQLDAPYVQFSLFDPIEKDRIDRIIARPEPDTRIEILVYFKPLQEPFAGPALTLAHEPPRREGFTLVEWGGTVDDERGASLPDPAPNPLTSFFLLR